MAVYEQFVAFGTDLGGLERLLRLFQATCSLLIAYPLLLATVWPNASQAVQTTKTLGLATMRGQLNVSRRFIRLFRFLDTLQSGWTLYVAEDKSLEVWLGIISKTSLGLFGMTETLTLVDLLGIPGLQVFGPLRSKEIDAQSQYLWFGGLAASVLISLIKLNRLNASGPVQDPTKTTVSEKGATKEASEKSATEAEKEKQRLQEISAKKAVLIRGLVSDSIDILLPGSAIGLVKITSGQVSAAMFFTTLTTGWAAWDRVGEKLQK
ncbi:peroxisomal biogenesis factor 11 [Dactylonectria estremocensis]|uniref:Peroxisomal biogenesis factor 11 n=1 Tax=Dactylonectria estremocensis TaxID=1079267 RepID=A0A9P9F3N9_9HYPO|nr:peroxisomal biogenesis factor 11 [Dactylonectria estremocensis]